MLEQNGQPRRRITLFGKCDITTTTFTWLVFLCLASSVGHAASESHRGPAAVQKKQLDPDTLKVLSSILDSLDTFTNHRLKDLEKIRLAGKNSSASISRQAKDLKPFDGITRTSNITDSIQALKEGIMAHRPMKKTFGYKVTVYTSPIEKDGKDGKPMLVTQYVGGDLAKDESRPRQDESARREDLEESAAHPRPDVVRISESAPYPVVHVADEAGAEHVDDTVESAAQGGLDHERKTEHQHSSEKGHRKSLSEKSKIEKGHDRQKHKENQGEHHKETDKESHRQDLHTHDKGGATQQGIRERTEIEYYEREHFLDTELDKDKGGHAKSSGVKEHESHNDHDSHERKREHATTGEKSHEHGSSASSADASKHVSSRPTHYTPPYGSHYPSAAGGKHESVSAEKHKEGVHHSEKNVAESKARKEHNSERDRHSHQDDSEYHDKDKARRKEGYRERGYKITAEREYFLNDAHHDTGTSAHKSGERSRDREGARQGSKEGERDRGFVKEHKSHDSHDAAYDAKERKFHDGEKHTEGFAKSSAATSSASAEKKYHEDEPSKIVYLQDGPPVIRQPPIPVYPQPIAYDSSDDEASPVIAYPPHQRNRKESTGRQDPRQHDVREKDPRQHDVREKDPRHHDVREKDPRKQGYVGYASYNQKPENDNPILKTIRDSIRDDVKAPPPSYSKTSNKVIVSSPAPDTDKYSKKQVPEITQYGTHLGGNEQKVQQPNDRQYPAPNQAGTVYFTASDKARQQQNTPKIYVAERRPPPTPVSNRQRYHSHHPQAQRVIFQGPNQYRQQDFIRQPEPQRTVKKYQQQDYDTVYPIDDQQNVPLMDALSLLLPKLPDQPDPSLYIPQDNVPSSAPQSNKYSPVVILSRGPSNSDPALDVWYTRQQH